MKRRILDLTAAAILFELLFVLGTIVACQRLDSEKGETPHFGSSLAELQSKPKKKRKEERTFLNDKTLARPLTDNDDDVLRVDTTLVVNEIAVQDKNGQPVLGLGRNDFLISEDSTSQTIEIFASAADSAIPRSVVLIIDYSESELPYIETSIEAAKVLVDKLKASDQMALVTDDVGLLTGFTSDKILLKAKLDSLKEKAFAGNTGKSKQYSALWAVLKELFPEGTLRPIILFQTDGDQLSDFTGYGFNGNEMTGSITETSTFRRLLSAVEESGATVYTIAPGPSYMTRSRSELLKNAESDLRMALKTRARIKNTSFDESNFKVTWNAVSIWAKSRKRDASAMEYLSQHSGGDLEQLAAPEEADAVYSRIFTKMNQRYVIGYYPTNQFRDGTQRKIKITVRDHSDYKVLGRKSYIAPGRDQ